MMKIYQLAKQRAKSIPMRCKHDYLIMTAFMTSQAAQNKFSVFIDDKEVKVTIVGLKQG